MEDPVGHRREAGGGLDTSLTPAPSHTRTTLTARGRSPARNSEAVPGKKAFGHHDFDN